MRRLQLQPLVPFILLTAWALPWAGLPAQEPASPPADLVVHEWGTFVSLQGSDSVVLDGILHEEEHLPHWVYSRQRQGGWREFQMKMETPVTYFYSPTEQPVKVAVRFPSGLFTEWFPDVHRTEPPLPADRAPSLMDGKTNAALPRGFAVRVLPQNGLLDWGVVKVLAPSVSPERRFLFPASLEQFTWAHARATDSNLLQVPNGEHEKFLFYRGLGQFLAPLRIRGLDAERIEVDCRPGGVARRLLLLQVEGDQGGFAFAGDVAAGVTRAIRFPAAALPLEEMVAQASARLQVELQAEGLFAKEAKSMVDTWSRQYFRTPGRRVLYVLDQEFTDRVLPLSIEPKPVATVRVMVARVECLSPEQEQRMVSWARALAAANQERRAAGRDQFLGLGRFAEPCLRRVEQILDAEPQPRAAVRALLAEVSVRR
jgi:hypothetical protein